MTLEQQVCNLEQAKKLKELGVKQDSVFYCSDDDNGGMQVVYVNELIAELEQGILDNALDKNRNETGDANLSYDKEQLHKIGLQAFEALKIGDNGIYSCFTVAELGEMLPYELFNPAAMGNRKVMNNSTRSVGIWKYENQWNNRYTESDVNSNSFLNEAECRADMLIYLLENKLISL